MSSTDGQPDQGALHGVAVYNPRLMNKEETIETFVVRRPLLDRLVDDLRREGPVDATSAPQHRLIVGQRGMGKTMLLHRLRFAVEDDPQLAERWLALSFPEEQYNVARLSDLWLNCLDALGDAMELRGQGEAAAALDQEVQDLASLPEAELAPRALALLLHTADTLAKRLLLLLDNFDLILERLSGDHWAVREVLSHVPALCLVGASSRFVEATYDYNAAFYDFFEVDELRGLGDDDVKALLLSLAERAGAEEVARVVREQPERLAPMRVLTGGNPRTIVLLYEVFAEGIAGDLRSDLDRLLDRSTPLYKARFEALAPQAQQVVDGLAVHWDPVGAGELATLVRLDNRAVSTQLDRLVQAGVVEKVRLVDPETGQTRRKSGYILAERFFNIWYLMRAARRVRRRLVWLVQFLKLMHTPAARSLQPDDPNVAQTQAFVLAAAGRWAEAAEAMRGALAHADERYIERAWDDIVKFFAEAVRLGRAAEGAALLDEVGLGERWRPLVAALEAAALGSPDVLLALAPEAREPASALYGRLVQLAASWETTAEAPAANAVRRDTPAPGPGRRP